MLFGLPLAFTQHLDAGAVDQEVQSLCCRLRADRHRKILLATANGTEVGHLPVQASKLEQALRHAHRLAQGQVEQALDRQAELDRRLAVLRTAAPLAAGTAVPAHVLVQPDEQGATRLQRLVVVFPVGRSVLRFCWGTHADNLPHAHARPLHRPICATKPLHTDGVMGDDEMKASLDRIDSNAHYEAGNLQVVCRFINRWKGADSNSQFKRLIERVGEH